MKFSTALVALALAFAGAEARMEHRHVGPSAVPTSSAAPTTTVTPAAPPAATQNNAAATSGKRGVVYNNPAFVDGFGSKITWAYDWTDNPSGALPAGKEFVPMLWAPDNNHIPSWANNVNAALNAGATHILGFNEPDLSSQSNLSPAAAAAAWKQYIQPYAGRAKLCSPAITNGGPPMGTAWLDSFLAACTGCTIDCIAIHIYDSATNVGYFENYISGVGSKYGKPVWVTEFGASGSLQQQQQFFQTLLPFLDNLASVERYSYFMAGGDILVDDNGNLTPLGQSYNSV